MQTPPIVPPGLDPNFVFNELMPLIAIVTLVGVGALALRWIFRTPVGEAIAQRIREGKRPRSGAMEQDAATRAELEARVMALQEHVGELSERLDFAERLLAERRERPLGPGGR
jgi:hypothetical protein